MMLMRRILREGKTRWLESFQRRPVTVALDKPIVSLCFDDVPQSTFANGLPLLNRYGLKVTFYACLGMPKGAGVLGPDELLHLRAEGHELGCHTASHYCLPDGSAGGLAEDAKRNRDLFSQFFDGMVPDSFSYPFGILSHHAKRVLEPHYRTMRSGRAGVNVGSCDFNCLRAVSLECGNFDKTLVETWLDCAERRRGWLIFYTHGITPNPQPYDLTPAMLEALFHAIMRRGLPVLPVSQVAEMVSGNPMLE